MHVYVLLVEPEYLPSNANGGTRVSNWLVEAPTPLIDRIDQEWRILF